MATLSSKLVVSLVDRTGPGSKSVLRNVNSLKAAATGATAVGPALASQSRKMAHHATNSAMVGAGLLMIGRSGFDAAYGLEKTMNAIQSVGDISDDSRARFKTFFKELNKDFPFTNVEIAEAALEQFRAGFDEKRVRGSLASSLRLAMAGDIGRGEAADIMTNILTAMRLDTTTEDATAKSSQRVADVIAYSANRANTDVRLMGQTIKFVGPIAAAAGIQLEKLGAMAMIMANNGIKGSEAGVALRSGIVRMLKPTKDALRVLEKLNINIQDYVRGSKAVKATDVIQGLRADGLDVSGLKHPIAKLLDDPLLRQSPAKLGAKLTEIIANAIGDSSTMSKQAISESIQEILLASGSEVDLAGFYDELRRKGVDLGEFVRLQDVRQGARLITLLTGDINKLNDEIVAKSDGYAGKAASTRMKGIVGQSAAAAAAYENLFVTIGDSGVMEAIGKGFDRIAAGLRSIAATDPVLLERLTYALMGLAVIGPLGFLMSGVVATFAMIGSAAKLAAIAVVAVTKALKVQNLLTAATAIWSPIAGLFGRVKKQATAAKASIAGMALGQTLSQPVGAPVLVGAPTTLDRIKSMGRALFGLLHPLKLLKGLAIVSPFAALFAGATWMYNNADGLGTMLEGIGEGFMKNLGPAEPIVKDIWAGIEKVGKYLGDLLGPLDASKADWKSWGETIGAWIAWPIKGIGKLIERVKSLGRWLTDSWVGRQISKSLGFDAPPNKPEPSDVHHVLPKPPKPSPIPIKKPQRAIRPPPTQAPAVSKQLNDNAASMVDITKLRNAATQLPRQVRSSMDSVKSIVNGVDFTSAGQRLMLQLAAGIRLGTGEAVSAMSDATQRLKNHVPQSPAKEGPLRGIHRHGLMGEIARGIQGDPAVASALAANLGAARKTLDLSSPRVDTGGGDLKAAMASAAGRARAALDGMPRAGLTGPGAAAGGAGAGAGAGSGAAMGDIIVNVNVAGSNASPAEIADQVGRRVRNAAREYYSDGGF